MNVKETGSFLVSQVEEEELPALEFIDDSEVSPHIQVRPPDTDREHIHTTTAFIPRICKTYMLSVCSNS